MLVGWPDRGFRGESLMKNDANIDVEVLDIPEYIDQPEYVKK